MSLNAQAAQVSLKWLDLVLQHFFRRVKLGQKQGCPRFTSLQLNTAPGMFFGEMPAGA